MLSGIGKILVAASITACAALETPDELHKEYYTIFPNGNRNAASHRWATYVLERSTDMTDATLRNLFASFCAVSGSPVRASPQKRWKMTLPLVGKDQAITGMMYFCCSPCVCDTKEFIKVDTKTITTKDGPKQYYFTVIGNPCLHPEALTQEWQDSFDGRMVTLQQKAPDVKCSGDELEKAMRSDHGHIIIGMFFEEDTPNHATSDLGFSDSKDAQGYCQQRADNGYQSGMGQIFRKVALITPVSDNFYASSNEVTQGSSVMWSETTTLITASTAGPTTNAASTTKILESVTSSQPSDDDANMASKTSSTISSSDQGTAPPSTTQNTNTIFLETTEAQDGITSSGMQTNGSPLMFTSFFVARFVAQRT
eukprot:gnl/MRDRNA2_/MRDRNA2_74818_c0_seq3.p1 gnl/MRDRNA2_/MRDRNA2_74818_c0~~gnl/MRDRNA2_/MRDRNA2_74818_c0_seq3.p1  ORF type:complete len:368 (-),score=63.45 gnl/MRDRNA2_/MRDRNA2_74818_c0_seq3:384-1487(-)